MKRALLILFSLASIASQSLSQSMNSLTGLYTIPTAEIPKDGEVTLGAFFLKREYLDPDLSDYRDDVLVYFGSMSFLPFLETSLRFTKPLAPKGGGYAIGDRMIAVKVQPFREGVYTPSLSIGAQDFIHSDHATTNGFNSTYIVATKNFAWTRHVGIQATAGYGFKAIDARAYQFIGIFGGIAVNFFRTAEVICEYDALDVNGAVRLDLFNHIRLLGGIVKGKYFSGGASCYFEL